MDPKAAKDLNPYIIQRFGMSGVNGLFKAPMNGKCIVCAKERETYDVGAMSPAHRACRECVEKHGIDKVRAASDEAAQMLRQVKKMGGNDECMKCHKKFLLVHVQKGNRRFFCEACTEKLQKYAYRMKNFVAQGGKIE